MDVGCAVSDRTEWAVDGGYPATVLTPRPEAANGRTSRRSSAGRGRRPWSGSQGFLLRQLVAADFKLRYQGSVLGYLWSLARPLALFSILYVVFVKFFAFGSGVPNFPLYLLLGIVLWTFFSEATMTGLRAITDKGDMIRKVSISKQILVVAPVAAAFVNLALNLLVVAIFAVATGVGVSANILLLPVVLIELLVLSTAACFLLSALYVKYRDMVYIWELLSQVLFYVTPIIYPLTLVPDRFQKYLLLNPLTQMLQDARFAMLDDRTGTAAGLLPAPLAVVPYALVLLAMIVSVRYFNARSRFFAETI